MKTAISIPDPVFEAAENLAKNLGVSRSELFSSAIVEFMENHKYENVTEALNKVYATEDSSVDEQLSFQTRATFNKGRILTVWVTTDYEKDPREADWKELEARISEGTADGSNEKFVGSGSISLDCVTGTMRIAFRYLGGDPGPTTNYDIDNILIRGKVH